jgi:small-conductance mechanosensitive channel
VNGGVNGGPQALADVLRDASQIPWLRIAAIVVGAWLLVRLLAWALPRAAEALPAGVRIRVLPLVPALRLVITLVAVLWIVPLVISPTPQNLVAVLGALGIALGFAFKDYAASLVAGVVAVSERPYRQGDWVRIGDVYGEVRTVGLRAVQLVTPEDDVVTFPHGVLWTEGVANANDGGRTLQVVARVWLEPDHDGTRLRERLREVAWTSPWLDVTRPVEVIAREEPWGTRYDVKAYPLDARDQFRFLSDLTVRAKEVVAAQGARYATAPAAPERSELGPPR